MTRRGFLSGLCLLAALIATCAAAPGASAIVTGTTAFTCQQTGKGEFTDADCSKGGSGEFQPVAVAEKTATELFASSPGSWKLTSLVGKVVLELTIEQAVLQGSIENRVVGFEHTISGFGTIGFREASVVKPAKEGCTIYEEGTSFPAQFMSAELFYTSNKQGDGVLFERPAGTNEVLATFSILGCANKALNGKYELTGSFATSSVNGAILHFTHASTTAQKTLKLSGAAAGVEGQLTAEGKKPPPAEELFTPLSFTTVGT